MKSLIPQLCWGISVSGKGEYINKKTPMLSRQWCRKQTQTGCSNEQYKHITHSLEMPIPYSVYSQISKKILYGKVRDDVREIISTFYKYKDVVIIAGAVCIDHVHLSVAIPPKFSVSNFMGYLTNFMGYLKGKSYVIYNKEETFNELRNREKECDIQISDYLENRYLEAQIFLTANYPHNIVLKKGKH